MIFNDAYQPVAQHDGLLHNLQMIFAELDHAKNDSQTRSRVIEITWWNESGGCENMGLGLQHTLERFFVADGQSSTFDLYQLLLLKTQRTNG
jgi:hypothetical protein